VVEWKCGAKLRRERF